MASLPRRYTRSALFPQRIHRILDTTATDGGCVARNQSQPTSGRHQVSQNLCTGVALSGQESVRWVLASGTPLGGLTSNMSSSVPSHSVVASCYDSALMKLVRTPPFRDVQADERLADQTLRWDPALFDDRRYRLLTDEDLAYVTRRIEKSANHIRDRVSDLRHAVWEELDRVQNCPPSPITRTADEVDTFFRSDRWHNVAPWRGRLRQF